MRDHGVGLKPRPPHASTLWRSGPQARPRNSGVGRSVAGVSFVRDRFLLVLRPLKLLPHPPSY